MSTPENKEKPGHPAAGPVEMPGETSQKPGKTVPALEVPAKPVRLTKAAVTRRVKRVLGRIVSRPWHKLRRRDSLRGDLGFDSEALVLLTARVRKEFVDLGVKIVESDVVKAKSLGDLSDTLWKKYLAKGKA